MSEQTSFNRSRHFSIVFRLDFLSPFLIQEFAISNFPEVFQKLLREIDPADLGLGTFVVDGAIVDSTALSLRRVWCLEASFFGDWLGVWNISECYELVALPSRASVWLWMSMGYRTYQLTFVDLVPKIHLVVFRIKCISWTRIDRVSVLEASKMLLPGAKIC